MLTQVAGAQVCPSDDVDMAWRLHITRSADYARFCGDVLGNFLHHPPAGSGQHDLQRERAAYAATLSHYRRAFHAAAPDDVWPAVHKRFDVTPPPEPAVIRLEGAWACAPFLVFMGLGGVLILALALDLLGVLDATHAMSGPAFLGIAVPVTIALLILGVLSTSPFAPIRQRDTLDIYEAAWLIGAEGRMTATALGLLIERGCAQLRTEVVGAGWRRRSVMRLVVTGVDRFGLLHPVELACLATAREGVLTFARAHAAMRPWTLRIGGRLRAAGMAIDDTCIAPKRAAMAVVTAGWLVVAIERLLHAVGSGRPMGILIVLTAFALGLFAALVLRTGRTNWRSHRVLRELAQQLRVQSERGEYRAKKAAARTNLDARLLPMTLALLGPAAVLAEPSFAGLDDAFGPDGMRLANAQVVSLNGGSGGDGGGGCGGGGCGGGCGG